MIAPNRTTLAETVNHAIGLGPLIKDEAAWVYGWAFLPSGPNRDRPTKLLPLPDPAHPDHVESHPADIGIGSPQARYAYSEAARQLTEADRLALVALITYSGQRPTQEGHWLHPVRGEGLLHIITRVIGRHQLIIRRNVIGTASDDVLLLIHSSADHVIAAYASLMSAQKGGGPRNVRRCVNCNDPVEDVKRRECWKCAKFRVKYNRPRPIRRNAEAIDAKKRRIKRGEDFGVEDGGVQAGRVGNDGEWEPATPVTPIFRNAVDSSHHPASPRFRS